MVETVSNTPDWDPRQWVVHQEWWGIRFVIPKIGTGHQAFKNLCSRRETNGQKFPRDSDKGNDARSGNEAPNTELETELLCHYWPWANDIHGIGNLRCTPLDPDQLRVVSIETLLLVYDLLLRLKEWGSIWTRKRRGVWSDWVKPTATDAEGIDALKPSNLFQSIFCYEQSKKKSL